MRQLPDHHRASRTHPGQSLSVGTLGLEGTIETDLARLPAVEVEETYTRQLAASRERDRAAGVR